MGYVSLMPPWLTFDAFETFFRLRLCQTLREDTLKRKNIFLMLLAGEQFLSPHGIIHLELTQNSQKI